MHTVVQSASRRGGSHLLKRRDHHAGTLLGPGADVGKQLDFLDGGVGLAHLVAPPELLAAAARRHRRRELQVVRGRQHCGREGPGFAPAD